MSRMLKGYIIEKYNNMGSAYTCARLAEEARKTGVTLDIVGVHDTVVNGPFLENRGRRMERRDIVVNRYKWGHVKDGINALADRSYNRIEYYKPFIDKYVQLERLDSSFFTKPKYLLGTVLSDFDRLADQLGLPFVAKGLESSMGREIWLIRGKDDLAALSRAFPIEKEVLYEEFIATSYGRDLRLLGIRGEAVACMMRQSQSDFRANVALGGAVSRYPVNPELERIAADIYAQSKLDVVGIDLLFGRQGLVFCEINVMPGLEGIERATGVNVAGRALQMIKEDFQ